MLAAAGLLLAVSASAQPVVRAPMCNGLPATIVGTGGDDNLSGTAGPDVIVGLGGNDIIKGFGDNDTICGNAGDDLIAAGDGDDFVLGGAGNDEVYGGAGNDHISGGGGDDVLRGAAGNDTMDGGTGNDVLRGAGDDDVLRGGFGNDLLIGATGADELRGEDGVDDLRGGPGDDIMFGGGGNDQLFANGGDDTLDGGDGNDDLRGGSGIDTMNGGSGDDLMLGANGDDTMNGGDGVDNMQGGDGADVISAGSGNDLVKGGPGDDTINGDDGDDDLRGNGGADTIDGGNDIDTCLSWIVRFNCEFPNTPPVPGPDGYATAGNTLLEVGVAASGAPAVQVAGSVLDNDTDGGDGPFALQVTTFDAASTLGGTVAMNPDGTFSYVPPAGVTGVTDDFTYTISDNGGLTTSVGTVEIDLIGLVWYVDNTAAGPLFDGTSTDPFDTLVGAELASGPGDTIFVHEGDGTDTNQDEGIALQAGQTLLGEAFGLDFAPFGSLFPAGNPPLISNANTVADPVIGLDDTVIIRGLDGEASTGNGIDGSGITGPIQIELVELRLVSVAPIAVNVDNATGQWVLDNVAITSTGAGIPIQIVGSDPDFDFNGGSIVQSANDSTLDVSGLTGGTVTFDPASTITGFNGDGLQFDGTAGTFDFQGPVLLNGGDAGIDILGDSTGTFTFDDLTVTNPSGVGLFVDGGTSGIDILGTSSLNQAQSDAAIRILGLHTGTVTFDVLTQVNATNGTGLQFDGANGTYDFNGQVSLGGGDAGIDILGGSTGTFTFDSLDITDPANELIVVNGGSADVTVNGGTLSQTPNNATGIDILGGHTGSFTFAGGTTINGFNGDGLQFDDAAGTYDFNGTVTLNGGDAGIDVLFSSGAFTFSDLRVTNPTSGPAINIDSSPTSTVNLVDLDIDTNPTAGITSNGGTLNVGGGTATVDSTGAPGIDLDSVGGSLTFDSISSAGSANEGIDIDGMLPGATFTVSGITDVDSATNAGIDIAGSQGTFTFADVDIDGAGGDGINLAGNATTAINIDGGAIDDTTGSGIRTTDSDNVNIGTPAPSGVVFGGAASIGDDAITVFNTDGTGRTVTVLNNSTLATPNVVDEGIEILSTGTGTLDVTLSGNDVRAASGGLFGQGTNPASLYLSADNNTFEAGAGPAVEVFGTLPDYVYIRVFDSNTVAPTGTGGGAWFNQVTFDADPSTGAFDQVTGGTLGIGCVGCGPILRVTGDGLSLIDPAGDLHFTSLDVANDNGIGLEVLAKTTPFALGIDGGDIDTTNGPAFALDPLTAGITLDSVVSDASPGAGLVFDTVAGTVDITSATVSNATTNGILVTTSPAGTFTFGTVDIDTTGGDAVSATDGGSVVINGGEIDGITGDGIDATNTSLSVDLVAFGANAAIAAEGVDVTNSDAVSRTVSVTNSNIGIGTPSNRGIKIHSSGTGTLTATLTGNAIDATSEAIVTTDGGTAGSLVLDLQNSTLTRSTAGFTESHTGSGLDSTIVRSWDGPNQVIGGTGGGVLFDQVTFDASGTSLSGTQVVMGGTGQLDIGSSGARVQGDGLSFLNPTGSLSFPTLNVFNNNGTGLKVDTKGLGTTFTLATSGGTVDTTNGAALDLDPLTMGMTLTSVTADGGTNGVIIDESAGTFVVNGTTDISNTTGAGILLSDNTATVTFGATTIATPGTAGIDVEGTNGDVTFGDVDITGIGAGVTGFDASGAATDAKVSFNTLDISGTDGTGIDLTGTTNGKDVTTALPSAITGVATGVDLTNAAQTALVQFGDGVEPTIDSVIDVSGFAIDITGLNDLVGTYDFEDVGFGGSDISNLQVDAFFVDFDGGNNAGIVDGTPGDPGTIAQAEASGAAFIVLVDQEDAGAGTQDSIDANTIGDGTLNLADGQSLLSFRTTDTFNVGGGAPANVLLNSTIVAGVIDNPNPGSGAPLLTTSLAAANTVEPASAGTVTVDGVEIDNGSTGDGISATDVTSLTVQNSRVTGGASGIDVDTTAGATSLSFDTLVLESGPGAAALDVDGSVGGTTTIAAFDTITVGGGLGTGSGISIASASFDSGGGGAVLAGSGVVGTSVVRVTGDGLALDDVSGELTFDDLDIGNDGGTGLLVQNSKLNTFTLNVDAGDANDADVDTINGTGIDLDPVTVTANLNSVTVDANNAAASSGIVLDDVEGTFTVSGSVAISETAAAGIDIRNNNTQTTPLVATFAGPTSVDNGTVATGGAGVSLADNTGASIDFTGNLDIDTTSGTGFGASGGGTLTVTGATNTITTTESAGGAGDAGAALDLNGITIGVNGITIDAVSATDVPNTTDAVSVVNVDNPGSLTINDGLAGVDLTVDGGDEGVLVSGGTAAVSVSGAVIDNSQGAGISLQGATGAITFGTVDIDGTGGAGIAISGNTNTVLIDGGTIGATTTAGGDGVNIDGGTGTVTIDAAITQGTANNSVDVRNRTGGSVTFNGLVTDTAGGVFLDTNATGTVNFNGGLNLSTGANTAFSATGSGTVNVVDPAGKNSGVDNTASTTTATAVNLDNVDVGGSGMTFTSIDKTAAGGTTAGISISNTGSVGNTFDGGAVTVAGTGGLADGISITSSSATFTFDSATISSTGDAGINLGGANGPVTFTTVAISGTTNAGIDVADNGDLVNVNGGTITTTTGNGVDVLRGTEPVTIAASITNTSARAVEVTDRLAGTTVTFSGAITDTGATGINLATNASGVSFTSTVDITNSTGAAVTLDGNAGGTFSFSDLDIVNTGSNQTGLLTTGSNTGATLDSTTGTVNTGTAVAVDLDTIALGVTLRRVDTNGASTGIDLNTTTGSFEVTGTGTTDGSGGTITGSTADGVTITNADNITLRNMNILSSADDGVDLTDADGVTLVNVEIDSVGTGTGGGTALGRDGVHALRGTNLRIEDSLIENIGNDQFADGVHTDDLTGTLQIIDSVIDNMHHHGVRVDLDAGGAPVLDITVTRTTISDSNAALNDGSGIQVNQVGAADTSLTVTGTPFTVLPNPVPAGADCRLTGLFGEAIEGGSSTGGVADLTVDNCYIADIGNDGVRWNPTTGGTNTIVIEDSAFFDITGGDAIDLNPESCAGAAPGSSGAQGSCGGAATAMTATVQRNHLDGNEDGAPAALTGWGIYMNIDAPATMVAFVDGNTVRDFFRWGIQVDIGDPDWIGGGSVDATISNNTVTNTGKSTASGTTRWGVEAFINGREEAWAGPDACLVLEGNVITGSGREDIAVVANRAAVNVDLEDYVGPPNPAGPADEGVVAAFLLANNPGTGTSDVTIRDNATGPDGSINGVASGSCATP